MKHYLSYIWKEGIPYGIQTAEDPYTQSLTYKIISDPYHKWISLEEYSKNHYVKTIYDSSLLDFRNLKPAKQHAWQKITLSESDKEVVSVIRDHNDRVILFENYLFEEERCRECKTTSPYGNLLSIQKILYQAAGDPFNGVILYDSNEKPVMHKKYKIDEAGEFTELLEENWTTIDYKRKSAPKYRRLAS